MSVKTFPSQYDVDGNGGNLNSEQNLTQWMSGNIPGIPSTAIIMGTSSQTNIVGTPGEASGRRYFALDNDTMFQTSQSGTTVSITGGTIIFEGYLISVDAAQMVNPQSNNYRCSIIVPLEKITGNNPPIKHKPVLAVFPINTASGETEIPFQTIFGSDYSAVAQDSNFLELPILNFEIVDGSVSPADRFIKEFRIDLDSVGSSMTVGANSEASLQDILQKLTEMVGSVLGTADWQTPATDPDNPSTVISLTELASRTIVRSKVIDSSGTEQSGSQNLPFLQKQDSNNYELNVGYLPKADGTTKAGIIQVNGTVTPNVNAGTLSVSNGVLSSTAEVNQNAFSTIGYGNTSATSTVVASSKTDQVNIISDGTLSITGNDKTITAKVVKLPEDSEQTFKSLTLKNTTLSGDSLPNALFTITKSNGGWVISVNGSEIARYNGGSSQSSVITGNANVTGNLNTGGNIVATGTITGSKVYNAVYNDLAEFYEKLNYNVDYMEGTVIAKSKGYDRYTACTPSNRKLVVGVCSNSYGQILGGELLDNMEENKKKFIPVGLAGRIPVRCIGRVDEGDLLVPSDKIAGVAEVGCIPGMIIGKALESYDPKNRDQEGLVLMQIMNA